MNPVQASTTLNAPAASAHPVVGPPLAAQAPRVPFRSVLLQERALASSERGEPSTLQTALRPAPRPPTQPGLAPRASAREGGLAGATSGPAQASRPERGDDEDAFEPRQHARHAAPDLHSGSPPVAMLVGAAAPAAIESPAAASSGARAAASLEDLLPALVRRIAWSGDGHRGSVRLELGAGELAGGTLLVHAEAGRVSVHLDLPPGADAGRWQRRIQERLASRGVATDGVEVT